MAYYDRGRGVPARGVRADLLGSASEARRHRAMSPSGTARPIYGAGRSSLAVDEFTKQYIVTALWSSDDGGLNKLSEMSWQDLAPQTLDMMKRDAISFQQQCAALLDRAYQETGYSYGPGSAGHDFWLTRNHHGAGFWDRGLGEVGNMLTTAAHKWPEVDLYVGDDGLVYASGHESWANEARRPARMKLEIAGEAGGFRPGFQGGPVEMVTGQLGAGATRVKEGHLRGIRYEVYEDPNPPPRQRYRSGGKFAAVVWTPYDSPNHGRGVEGEIVGRSDTIDGAAEIAKNYIDRLAKHGEFWHGSENGPTEDKEAIADHLRAEGHGPEYIRMAIGDEAYAKWSRARGYSAGEVSRRRPPRHVSTKFERCVQRVKAQGRAVNPWAICHASLGQKAYLAHEARPSDHPVVRITFTRTTPESVEQGDFSETGWIDGEGVDMTPDEVDREEGLTAVDKAVKFMRNEGAIEPSSTAFHPGVWYSTEFSVIDYGTGEEEERSFHLDGFSPEEEREIYEKMTKGMIGVFRERGGGHHAGCAEDCIGIHTHHDMGPEALRALGAGERPNQPGYYAVYPNGRIASGPYGSRDKADGEAKKIGGFVQFEAGEASEAGQPIDFRDIQPGDRVTISNRFGQNRSGRAVMRGPAGWVLNMGGPHGTPDIATPENFVSASRSSRHAGEASGGRQWQLHISYNAKPIPKIEKEIKKRTGITPTNTDYNRTAGVTTLIYDTPNADIAHAYGRAIIASMHTNPPVRAAYGTEGHQFRVITAAGEPHADEKVPHADRENLPPSAFALRKRRALLLTDKNGNLDAGHVKAAAGRLSMMKHLGHLKPGEWKEGHARIMAAGKKVGLKVKEVREAFNAKHEAKEDFTVSARSPDEIAQADAARHIILKSPQDIYEFVAPSVRGMTQETFLVVPMDLHGSPLVTKPILIAMGQRDRVQVDPGDVVRPVIEKNAAAFVVCHQHPSGRPLPSDADKELTDSIREAARVACPSTVFLDHCIVGANEIYSFTDSKVHRIH